MVIQHSKAVLALLVLGSALRTDAQRLAQKPVSEAATRQPAHTEADTPKNGIEVRSISPISILRGHVTPITVKAAAIDDTTEVSVVAPSGALQPVSPTTMGGQVQFTINANEAGLYTILLSTRNGTGKSYVLAVEAACSASDPRPTPDVEPPGSTDRSKRCGVPDNAPVPAIIYDYKSQRMCRLWRNKHSQVEACPADEVPEEKNASLHFSKHEPVGLYVINKNPFLNHYEVTVNETTIPDDDVTSVLGVLVPALGAGSAAASVNQSAATVRGAAIVPPDSSAASCEDQISKKISDFEREYGTFIADYRAAQSSLQNPDKSCGELLSVATDLWQKTMLQYLSFTDPTIDKWSNEIISALDSRISDLELVKSQVPGADILENQYKAIQKRTLQYRCINRKAHESLMKELQTAVIEPLTQVFRDNRSFSSYRRLGPYADATLVTWSVSSTPLGTSVLPSEDIGKIYGECFQDSQNQASPHGEDKQEAEVRARLVATGLSRGFAIPRNALASDSNAPWEAIVAAEQDEPAGQQDNKQAASSSGPSTPQPPSAPDASGMMQFGGPRFVVSAGLTGGLLATQEYQKGVGQAVDASGKPISGKETANIIEPKTSESARISPMIFLNTRIMGVPHTGEVLFATAGVTGKPDNIGTSPEYLFGISPSFHDQWVLLTLGLYVGKQQQLTNGLFAGEEIPSTLSGDIPVQKNYHAKFGVALSFRIPKASK